MGRAYSTAVIGGGIIGLAAARALRERHPGSIVILEAEPQLAAQQTGHNSGVIHSGLYYRPGSLKARQCVEGRDALYEFCRESDIPHERCGKLVVATAAGELGPLRELERRGAANGLAGLRTLGPAELADREPHLRALEGLWVPQTGIVEFARVARALAAALEQAGVEIRTSARVTAIERRPDRFVLHAGNGEIETRHLLNCAGLASDRVARLCGLAPDVRIIPFRGEYWRLAPGREGLVRNLIYPVPDPRFPFLGVHFTRQINGGIEVGPNALLTLRRGGDGRFSFSARDALDSLSYRGFWRMAARYWSTGMAELYRSLNRAALVRALRRMIPDLGPADLVRAGSGVRAQAVAPDGALVDDFRILEAERMLHVVNAPSPAATASLAIGRTLAERAARLFELG